MNPLDFVSKWQRSLLSERSASQQHFLDLCALLDVPTPASIDSTGDEYTFEKGATKTSGGNGWADVWFRGHFAWEYKGKHKNLQAAYRQLLEYREDLENPPLLVVCDFERFEVHTNFTGTVKKSYSFVLDELLSSDPTPNSSIPPLDVLRCLFQDPERLRPDQTAARVTEQAAREFSKLADNLRLRGIEPHDAARFLIRLLFCLFAEDIGLLPNQLLTNTLSNTRQRPEAFSQRLAALFAAMARGGFFGADDIKHFNGGLFSDAEVIDLTREELSILFTAAKMDWASIEPSIFGTLFERSLDPGKRSQLGAHYTSANDILLVIEPVLMEPLRREWRAIQDQIDEIAQKRDGAARKQQEQIDARIQRLVQEFAERLAAVRVLDPACGSGNFLYVALRQLLDLEKEVVRYGLSHGLTGSFINVGPEQMHGIELNEYAHELAPITVAIGYIQWLRDNGFGLPSEPILKQAHTVISGDALLASGSGEDADAGAVILPEWPEADVIIGNPPFVGGKLLRDRLGDAYVERLFTLYQGQVARESDLICYFFERTRRLVEQGRVRRAGLLATNSIRGGANRTVLERIKQTGDIFLAWSDRPWVLDGAAVRISIVGFDNGAETRKSLDGLPVERINADLTGAIDLTKARPLRENAGLAFMGDTKGGAFDIDDHTAAKMLAAPLNPNGRPNSDVVRPWINALDITRRPRNRSIIDFGVDLPESDAALYEMPFEHVKRHVKPERDKNNRESYRNKWWIHVEPRPALRKATANLTRFIVTPRVATYRNFVWRTNPTLADSATFVFARSDDYFLGVLHSQPHNLGLCGWEPRWAWVTILATRRIPRSPPSPSRGRRGGNRRRTRAWKRSPGRRASWWRSAIPG